MKYRVMHFSPYHFDRTVTAGRIEFQGDSIVFYDNECSKVIVFIVPLAGTVVQLMKDGN